MPALLAALLDHQLVADAALVAATTADGHAVQVAHVVPTPGTTPARVRRVVAALGAIDGDALLVSVVSAIPRARDGEPDEHALRQLPVPASVTTPVALPVPETGRRHLGEFVDLPTPWIAGPPAALAEPDADLDGPSSLTGTPGPRIEAQDPSNLVEALLAAAGRNPDQGVHVVEYGSTRVLTYPELLERAKRTLAGLRAAGLGAGDATVLHSPSLAEHIIGLWACLLGGIRPVAVAQSATYAERTPVLDKLEHAWRDLGEPPVLSGGATVAGLRGHAQRSGLSMRVLDLAECADAEATDDLHRPEPGAVAMLQLSAGSTGKSKVIQITHRGLIRYAQAAREVSRMSTGHVFVNWLPLDHVAGLVMYHFGPVVLGCDNVQVPTADVLADPLRWLDLLHTYRAQHSWSPNFGFGLVADALASADSSRTWDLTPLRALVNAGEQCTEPVMRRFTEATARFGVRPDTVLLSWGMAETCTGITYQAFGPDAVQHVRQAAHGGVELLPEPGEGSSAFLSMGIPSPGSEFRIAAPDGVTVLPELRIGRLQGRGERVTPGYLNNPDANAEAFPDGDWFDTGDLAFVADGRVTITGRAKEIIIITGVHHFCHEIEDVVGALPGVATSFAAAFGVPTPDGDERLAVVFVPADGLSDAVVGAVRRRLAERFGLASVLLAVVSRDGFDKTTSGKIQRTAMRGRLLRGELNDGLRAVELAESARATFPDALHRPVWTPRAFAVTRNPGRIRVFGDEALAAALPGAQALRPGDFAADVIVVAPAADEEQASIPVLELVAQLAAAGWSGELVTVGHRDPSTALTAAIGATASTELPEVRAWHLELPSADPARIAEALSLVHSESVIAWRGRWLVRTLEPAEPVPGASPAIELGSCWLVTGGLGGVGRAILPGLGIRMLVVGRGPARDLAELGPDAQYVRVDVADADALEAAVVAAEARWGAPLAGVLHLAGVYESTQLADTTADRWRADTRAKVGGTKAVAAVLRRRPGSKLVAFSTLLTWFPGVGAGSYAAGNSYLEALTEQLGADHPVHTLIWGLWRSIGMNAGHDYRETAVRGKLLSFTPADGANLFTAALRLPPGQVLLGVDRTNPVARRMLPPQPLEGAASACRDAFGVDVPIAPAPTAAVVTAEPKAAAGSVRRLVRDELRKIVPGGIDPHTPFYQAGLGSLGMVRLHTALQSALGREFPLTELFSHPSEVELSAHLGELTGERMTETRRSDVRDRRIAIIGMAARFPGAPTLEQYWDNLLAGVISTTRFTRDELLDAGLPASLIDDPAYVPVSGALDDIAAFDADLFGISPAEAAVTDPQQRLFLQICQQTLEHAGYAGAPGRTGVYAGSGMALYSLRTYLRENLGATDAGDQLAALQVAIGNNPDFLATRVAYRLGLTGPAVTIRTACSTSLVAVHTAITALLAGDADMALAGAAALHIPGVTGYRYEQGSILSSTGACRAFDAGADGTVGGNGVAAVLLKPLEAALADGDTVHAVILGSAINNDGSAKQGFTWPGVAGQITVVRDALANAGIDPGSVGYIEAHGTGTALGDPIEVAALREAFGDRSDPLLVGSVKPNIGHLDSAAGMAGMLKAVLALRTGVVPPQANFATPNPALRLGEGGITVPSVPTPWPVAGVRRAGVTALGVGGTNAHVVLEQAPAQEPTAVPAPWIVPLAARGPQALAQLAESTAGALAEVSPADVLITLGAGRRRLPHRLVAWGDTADETAHELCAGGSASGVAGRTGPLVFAFTGQGVDCTGAGTALLAHPVSAAVLRRLLDQHRRDWGVDLLPPLLGEPHEWNTATLQPALLAVQLAQVALLAELGVRPEAVIGHSAGEYAALACAGALSEDDAMHLAAVRGALMQTTPEGALLAVFDDVTDLPGLSVAVRNGPRHVVFGGTPQAVADAERLLSARGVECRRLTADRAFHTSMVDPIIEALAGQAATLDWKPLTLPVYSGTGAVLTEGTVLGSEHVRTHTRSTADFASSVDELVADGHSTFVELGPSGVLAALGRQWSGTTWLPLRRRGADTVIPGLAALFCHGIELDWAAFAPGGRRVPLPTYPFQPTRHWIDPVRVEPASTAPAETPATAISAPVTQESAPDMPAEQTDDLTELVLTRVRELTAHHLGDKLDRITPDAPFFDLGADSLLMINMVRELEAAFGVRVAMRELFEEVDTPARLSAVVTERMSDAKRAELAPTPPPVTPLPLTPPPTPQSADPAPQPPAATAVQPVAAPAVQPAAVLAVQSAPVAEAQPMVTGSGYEAVVREQLSLMGRFSEIMSEQLAVLSGTPVAQHAVAAQPVAAQPVATQPVATQPGTPQLASPNTVAPQAQTTSQPSTTEGTQLGPRPTVAKNSGMTGGRLDETQRAHLDDLIARYTARTKTSKQLAQRYRRPLADSRAVVGFRSVTKELLYPLAARRAKGAYVEDVDGNTYVDITMGFGTLMFGHEPDFVTDAIAAYQADGMRLGPRGPETGEAAELLAGLTGLDRVAFATSGTEANSAAFRLARAHTSHTKIVTFDGSYHGHFDPVLGRPVTGSDGPRTVPVSAGVPQSAVAEMMVLGYGDEASLDVIRKHANEIAAVVLEAVPSRYPNRQPIEFVRELRRLCDETGIVLMFDEMLTGFRPHPQGAQGIFGVRADLATYGKLIGGGFPIGAIAGRADIMDWIDGGFWQYGDDSVPQGETTFFGGTYIQHPLAMVAAKAVLTHLRDQGPGLQSAVNTRTERLATTLNDFFVAESLPLSLERFGSLFRFAHRGNLELLFNHLIMEGVHVWEWRNFFLSTAHTDADVDFIADAVRNSLDDLRRGGFLQGAPSAAPAPRRTLPKIPVAVAKTAMVEAASTDVGRTTPDFSLYFFGDYPQDSAGGSHRGDKYAAILSAARFADRSGLHAVWLPERHFDSFGGVFPNPSVLAAAIAAQTSRVRLHSGSVVLPLHDPIRVAEEWSVVDNLSGGRVSIGVASGWHARDFVLAPEVYGRHREAMYEGVETIRALWRGESVSRTAGNGEQVEVKLYPTPIQAEPDFYTAIVGNPDSYRQAARGGFGVITNLMAQGVDELGENIALYRRTRAEAGLDPDGGRVVLLLHTYLGENTEQVRAEAFGPFCDYLRSSLSLFGQVTNSLGFSIDMENTNPEDLEYLLSKAYERYCTDRALIGTADDAEPIVARLAALGVDEIACFVDFGVAPARITAGLPHIDGLRSRFTDQPVDDAGQLDIRDASPTEQQIWYADQAFPGRPNYTESLVVALEGDLDVPALQTALTAVATRHDGLRSTFHDMDGVLKRVVAAPSELALPVYDEPGADLDEAARRVMVNETATPFDLAVGPLFAPYLVRLAEQRYLLVLRMHHLVIDTVSAMVLTEEISASYRAAATGADVALPVADPLPQPQPASAQSLTYWSTLLAGAPRELDLPYDHPRPSEPSGRGASVGAELDAELMASLRAVAREHRVTPFTALLAAWALTLRAMSGESDVVVGSPFAHRIAGAERAVGFFVHTLPLRVTIDGEASFGDVLKLVREQLLGAQEHRDAPLPEIVRALGGNPDPLRNPLFDTVVVYDNEATFELDLPGVRASLLDVLPDRAPVDLVLFLINLGDTIRCRLIHTLDLFEPATADRLLTTYGEVLSAVVADPHRPLNELDRLRPRTDVLPGDWTSGGSAPHGPSLLHKGTLDRRSGGPAVVEDGEVTTVDQLHARAASVARAISALGVPAETPVAILLPRGADAVAAMLGALVAGVPYVPLDPEQPVARLAHMVGKARVAAVLTTAGVEVPGDLPTILVDRLADSAEPAGGHPLTPADLAYVLFTSGSTGEPKGALVEHRSISNTVGWYTRDLGVTAADRLSWFCSPGFDASAIEVWPALRTGATLFIAPPHLRYDPAGLRDWLIDTGITVAFMPTPMGELLLDQPWPDDGSVALRHLAVGGDALHRRPPAGAPFRLWNVYGPTEAAVVSTWAEVTAKGDGPPAIGRPVPGTWVRVVNEAGRQVPVGEPGELLIGGTQLARGYAEPTPDQAARFVGTGEDRCYRTGDVVRWSVDGQLEFLYRSDQQVQIRGFRVEPREVEYQLATIDGVREAAVRAWTDPDGTVRLAAYVVIAPAVTVAELRARLTTRLPDYMIPATWQVLDALPLNTNGKLDRAALPEPQLAVSRQPAAARRGGFEQRLASLWASELGIDAVSPDATFFELGGHSLTAIRLVNRIRTELDVRLDVMDFLRRPTVRGLASWLAPQLEPAPQVVTQPEPVPMAQPEPPGVETSAPASRGQQHGYRVTLARDNKSVLTIATRFALHGELDVPALQRALTALMRRHPALRTRFREIDGVVRQQVMIAGDAPFAIIDASGGDLEELVLAVANDPADITAAGTFRATLFIIADRHADLLLTVHHTVSDGWSIGIIIRELGELYRAEVTGEAPDLPELTATYFDFTEWEVGYLAEPATQAAVREWADYVHAVDARPLLFPPDRPRTGSVTGDGAVHSATLEPELVTAIDAVATREGVTTFAVLVAAFAALAHEVTGNSASASMCGVANRPESRFENVVASFTHSSWVVVPVAGVPTFASLVGAARDAIWQRLSLQSVQARILNDAAGGPFAGTPPRVLFGLFNTAMPSLTLPGVEPAPATDVDLPVARAEQTWNVTVQPDGALMLSLEYSTDLFDAETIAGWATRFAEILTAGVADPESKPWHTPDAAK